MITINDYLDDILKDFWDYLDSGVCLCDLKEVHFDAGRVPNYKKKHVQQYYLLRFAYAYAFEYKCMYIFLFGKSSFGEKIKVSSIGCGTEIDYWSMVEALKECDMEDKVIKYKGFDQIDWFYKFDNREDDTVEFYDGDVVEVFANVESLGSDIYFFPKSISEFSPKQFEVICNAFKNKPIKKEKLHILVSLRSNEFHLDQDAEKVSQLIQAIENNGFSIKDEDILRIDPPDGERKIRIIDNQFQHPFNVYETLSSLNEQCKKFKENWAHCETDCERRLTWKPILNCDQVRFQAITFERK